jgi:hypothetical protein
MAKLLKGPDGKPMTDEQILHALRVYATNKYGGENKYDFLAIGDTIAQVESGNNPFAHQRGGGPGRGKYQYEGPSGSNSSKTSSQRLENATAVIEGLENPSWNTEENTSDFSKLSRVQQDILFLADKIEDPRSDLRSLASGETSSKDFWLDYHWSGKDVDRPAREAHWDEIVADMKRKQEELELNSQHTSEPILPPFKHKDGGFRLKKKYKVNKFQDGGFTENGDPTGREDEEKKKPSEGKDTSDYMNVLGTLGGLLKEYISGEGVGYGPVGDDNPKSVIQQPGNPFLNIAKHTKGIITEGLNKYIQENIRPGAYPDTKKLLTEILFANSDGQIPYNWESRESSGGEPWLEEGFISDAPIWTDSEGDPNLDEEAYALALGRPTSNKHFRLSEHTPSKGHEEGDIYYKSPDFKWSTLLKRMQGEYVGSEKKFGGGFWDVDALGKDGQDPYQNFTAHVGEDEGGTFISYYDKYDFASPAINKIIEKGGGKPISFYDKKYVTKNSDGTLSFVDSVEEDPTLRERTSLSEYSKYQLQQTFKK